ncbi:MAG: neuromedin U [Pseudanabaena sp.]|nr:MAG: neuromedin U [Pseudanabaena sp.]
MSVTLPHLSYFSCLVAGISTAIAPIALSQPIPTNFPTADLKRQQEAISPSQKQRIFTINGGDKAAISEVKSQRSAYLSQDSCWLRQQKEASGEMISVRSQQGEGYLSLSEQYCFPVQPQVSIRAADLAADKPVWTQFLTAEKLTEASETPQPPANSDTVEQQTTDIPVDTPEQVAKDVENPLIRRITIPVANRTSFGIGPFNRTANATVIAPLLPISIGENQLFVRPSIPLVYAPTLSQPEGGTYGLGDIRLQVYFAPKPTQKGLIWGIGPTFLFPTAGARTLGIGKWGIGPAAVAVVSEGRWTIGAQIENYWSIAGDNDRPNVSQLTVQPIINYTLDDGWYLVSSPIIAAFWNIPSGEKWVVPIGGGIGKVFKIGDRPFNVSVQAYWQAIRPDNTSGLSLVVQLQSIFPRW